MSEDAGPWHTSQVNELVMTGRVRMPSSDMALMKGLASRRSWMSILRDRPECTVEVRSLQEAGQ